MSTLSGIASKGEKGRSKFQSLDINSLYRGESLEPSQQKSTIPRRHGMQCLGKVPSARRPPANLPSLKSEHSGNDPAVSLVPSGGTGWGSKPGETTGPAATTSQPHTTPPAANIPVVAPQPPVVAPVIPGAVTATPSAANPPAPSQGPPPVMQQTVHSDKLWSSVMASPGEGVHPPSFLAHQSPQFQQEFPKLSSGDGQAPATGQKGGSDTQYGPGPSLRPQTEGSWIQGGGRNAGQPPNQMPTGGASGSHQGAAAVPGPLPHMQPGSDPTGGRNNLGPCVAPAGGMGPGGPATQVPNTGGTNVLPGVAPGGTMMPHMAPNAQQQFSRNIMSQFQMYRGAFSPNFQGPMHGPVRPSRYQYPTDNRFMARPAPNTVDDELVPRPIIKEEELSKMDDIARDAGWAIHDDDIVDYNQQLLFSDDESTPEEDARKDAKTSNKDEKRSNDRERERESERESNEREEHREDHRDKRNEPLPQRGPPEQPSRNWQPGRSSVNMDFRSPPVHGPVAPATHPLPHGGPGPASLDCPMPPVMRPVSHPGQGPGPHGVEDEDIWDERRRQQNVEVAMAIERAKQRKEEEEKRFQGTKQGAARKLQALEQKMKLAAEKEHHEESSTPGPDWEKDKDRDSRERDRSRTSSEGREEKGTREARDSRDIRDHRERDSDFRPISQIGERPAFMRGDRELTRNDRELPRNERDREIPRNERERDISRNERGRDIPRTERDRDVSRNDRDREVSRNERDRDITRIERDRELPRSDRDREISRSERDRDMQRSERDRDIQRGEREREIPRSERERDIPRSDRERDIPRGERDRDIARSERDRDIARNERDREIPRSERDREIPRSEREREIPRSEREREIPRSEREREIPRNERDREISRADRDREITRNERDREITRNERDREISRNDREIPRNDRDREIRGDRDREITRSDRDRDIGRNDRDRDIPRNGRERDIPCNERDRDGSRNEREVPRSERERELPRSERDRERDMRSERERERDIRNDRDRKPRDSRDRHDTRYLANLPPRFQRSGIDRSSGFYGGQGSQQVPPQPAVGSGPTQGPPSATQGVFPQGSASTQVFDPRWNPPHFPSGPIPAPGTVNSNIKSGYLLPRGRDGDASNPDRERERERERERNERDRERERELDDRERDKERPPSRDPRDRRDRHIGDIPERYRPNARERDVRSYPDNGISARKTSGNYYEGPPEYGRSYSRGSQEYDRNEYGRGRERDADVDSRSSESRDRESRLGNREGRDRDGRHYDDRRDGELIDEVYDRHPPPQQAQFEDHKRETVSDLNRQENNNDWREKDKKFLEDREKLERRDADGRREREERPQRPDSRDSRTSRESRNSRDSVREERSVHENDHKHSISNREVTGSWVEDHYPDMKEEKKKDFFREERRDVRHPPGPITREKLEASELRSDSKRNLTPLKRSTSLNCNEKKQDVRKADIQAPLEKSDRKPNETDVWNRSSTTKPLERTTPENSASTITASAAGQARFSEQPSSKPWADQIPPDDNTAPPSAAVPEEKSIVPIDSIKKDVEKDVSNNVPAEAPEKVKNNPKEVELEVERQEEVKKEEITGPVEVEPKREKSSRSRSGGARGRSDGRASRQGSGSYAVYRGGAMSWGQQRERGRRGLHRPAPSRASNAGEYTQATESEQSGDEASAESSKEDASRSTAGQRRPERERESRRPPRSPKQGQKKLEKEEKSRESRRADGEKGFGNTDLHRYDKRSGGYDAVRNSGREGFAPVGEPSRRGRGGAFRRGSVGRRYGPPSSKSPFGQPQEDGKHPAGNDDPKNKNCDGAPDPSKEDIGGVVVVDDQPGVTLEEERFTFDDADNGFQEVRNKKKEARQKDEQKVQQPQQQQQQQQQQQPQPQPQQQTQLQQPQSTSQASQQVQGVSQQPPLPQRSSGVRDKEGGRQKGNKQSSNSGSGQIPSPIPGSTQQIPTPIPQAPAPPNISQGLGGNIKTFDRPRPKLPPRLAKQRETSRIQKQQQQQQQQQQYVSVHNDVSEMNKINQSVSIFPIKDSPNPAPPPTVNAWDKPINAALRPNSPSANAGSSAIQISGTITNSAENCNLEVNEQAQSGASSQRSTPSGDKVSGKLGREVAEKTVLDGTSPPVQTIIFENTNYKSGPSELGMKAAKFSNHLKNSRIDKGRERKLGEDVEDVQLSFANKNSGPVPEMNKTSENKTEPIQMPIAFNKNEDSVDMKLDFTFDSELSQLTDDKKNKSMGLPRSMHLPQGVQSTISHGSTDELNFKIASVKKVWEAIPPGPPVIEHNEDGSVASTASSFTPTFGNPVDSGLEPSFPKVEGSSVAGDDGSALTPGEIVYSSGPQIQNNPNSYSGNVAVSAVPNMVKSDVPSTSSNVCKVKPQQQAVMSAGPSPIGHPGPLSPPPFNSSNTQQGHINYQPTLGGTAAPFGSISAIPSPPTVLSYSSQQIPSQGGLYGAFQLDGTQVRSGQALSQFSGFPPYGLNQGLAGQTSAFNQQSMYLPTAPHPPPSAAPDIYPSSLSQYRIPAAQGPFGQSQQLSSNPSTVLISSTSNSLMSASVKPSSQQIGAIGTKGGGPYQQSGLPSQPSQLYIQYDPSYLSGSQMVQRPGPVQSNVVPTIPHSSSFYSGSAGGQAGFYQATNSTLQQGPSGQPLHQTGSPYGLQGYSTQSGTATPVGLQGFSSQMPQYRGTSLPAHTFLKSGQHPTDHNAGSNGRTQLKSPSSSQQDVLASVSVFSSGPQIPSPKSRSSKQQGPQQQQQQQQQQSPNQQQPSQQNQQQPPHHKFSPYQGMTASTQLAFPQSVRGQMSITVRSGVPTATQRYPQPIQRPVPFPGGGTQGANTMGGRHRPQHQQPSRQPANVNKPGNNQPYYSHGSNVKMESVSDGKPETAGENKITENVTVSGSSNTAPGSSKPVTSVASQPEHKISPAENGKEESAAPAAE